jgi:hypothetical protein
MNQPQIQDYPEWAKPYISVVQGDVMDVLEKQATDFAASMHNLIEKADYAYAPGKWTIKEMMGHIIDTERIFAYRMLSFARNEQAALPGFDENQYVEIAHFKDRSLFSLSEEFALLRKANLYLIKSLNEEELNRTGIASGKSISVRAMLYILAGHVIHHENVIKERYL